MVKEEGKKISFERNRKEEGKKISFERKRIRRVFYNGEEFFSVRDVVSVLVDSRDIKQYVNKVCKRLII